MKSLRPFAIDPSWTLFLDRDGVLNQRIIGGYVQEPSQLHVLPGVPEACAIFAKLFGRIVVATNQQGIGKGLYTADDLAEVHAKLLKAIEGAGGRIDQFYFAPELASENPVLRKPAPGMGYQAQQDFPEIDFARSIMVGDSMSDMAFGRNLGMTTVFLPDTTTRHEHIDHSFSSLQAFAQALESA